VGTVERVSLCGFLEDEAMARCHSLSRLSQPSVRVGEACTSQWQQIQWLGRVVRFVALKSGFNDFVGLHGRYEDVEHPEEDENGRRNGLEDLGAAQLSAYCGVSSDQENDDCETSLDTEDSDRESETAGGNHEGLSLSFPVDGSHGPGDTDAEEDIDSVGASNIANRGVSCLVFNGGSFGSKSIRHAGAQCNKCDCIDGILEVDEAAQVASDVSNHSSTQPNEDDGKNKCGISVVNCCRGDEGKDKFPWQSEEVHDVVST